MAKINYSITTDPNKTARAMGYELHISPKKSQELCNALRGMKTTAAKQYLEDIINKKKAVPFKKYTAGAGHKPGKIGPGKYPVNAAKETLKILVNAEGNAQYKGLDTEKLNIKHIATKKGHVIQGIMPRAMGRATAKNTETVTIEMILEEL